MHPMWERIEPLIPDFLSDESDVSEEMVPCLERVFYDWFFYRIPKGRGDVEDLAARTIVRICLNKHGFEDRGTGSFRAWCYSIADNVLRDWAESEEKWGARTASDDEWRALEDITFTGDHGLDDECERPEVISVRNVFQMLTALEQAALAMQVIDGLTDEEIARHLISSPPAIKQARYRAKRKFRDLLSADPQFADMAAADAESGENPDRRTDSDSCLTDAVEPTNDTDKEYRCDDDEK